jgi:hypothetical protein
VEPTSDESTIKKQYRKLALLLHPDKNQAKGAEAAFKLIGEAFGVLSDRNKRYLHDTKRGGESSRNAQMPSQATGTTSNSAYQAQYQAAAQATTSAAAAAQTAQPSSLTFWTTCPQCRMQYQYLRTYLNQTLLCQKCLKPFLANDINAPGANGAATFTWNNGPFPAGPVPPAPRRAAAFNFQAWSQNGVAPGSVPANGHARAYGSAHTAGSGNFPPAGAGVSPAAAAAAAANLVQEAFQRAQRERVAAEKAEMKRKVKEQDKLARQREKEAIRKAREQAKIQEDLQRMRKKREEAIEKEARKKAAMKSGTKKGLKKRKRDGEDDEEDEEEDLERSGYGSQADLMRKSSLHRRSVADGGPSDDDDTEGFVAAKKARTTANGGDVGHDSRTEKGKSVLYDDDMEIWDHSGAFGSNAAPNKGMDPLSFSSLAETFRLHLKKKFVIPGNRQYAQMPGTNPSNPSPVTNNNSVQHVGGSPVSNGRGDQKKAEANGAGEGEAEEEQIVVPDPDFHDFDADRTEVHVKKNQVWAVYDETDGMPRFYCQINKVTRAPSFSVDGVWLEPIHPEKDTFTWLKDRDLSIGTGEFRLGDECDFDSINLFSHLMAIKKTKSGYEVYPKKLEVWAVYRDYDKETSKDAEGKPKLRYDFVLVVSEFLPFTGQGRVVGLQKLSGYKTLWTPHGEPYSLTVKYDLHRFSHRVPALSVSETDLKGVPAGCLELDPASTPADTINPGTI